MKDEGGHRMMRGSIIYYINNCLKAAVFVRTFKVTKIVWNHWIRHMGPFMIFSAFSAQTFWTIRVRASLEVGATGTWNVMTGRKCLDMFWLWRWGLHRVHLNYQLCLAQADNLAQREKSERRF
jgi:hypothetical protein